MFFEVLMVIFTVVDVLAYQVIHMSRSVCVFYVSFWNFMICVCFFGFILKSVHPLCFYFLSVVSLLLTT